MIESNAEFIINAPLRRYDIVSCLLDRYYDFLIRDRDSVELDKNNEDSISYIDAMQRSDFDKWLEVMKSEIESIRINDV